MGLLSFVRPNVIKALTAFVLGIFMIYIGLNNFDIVKCSEYGCPEISSSLFSKIVAFALLWPGLLFIEFSYLLFNDQNAFFIFCAFMTEFLYAYFIVCIISYFAKRRVRRYN